MRCAELTDGMLLEAVRPSLLYLPITSEVSFEYQLRTLVLHDMLSRTVPQGLSFAIDADVLRRYGVTLASQPGGEKADGRIPAPVQHGAIVAIHVSDAATIGKWFGPLKTVQDVPIVGHDSDSTKILGIWHMISPRRAPEQPETVAPDRRFMLRRFFAMTEQEQIQLLARIHSLRSWIEGWQMEEGGHGKYARLFALLHQAVPPWTVRSLTTIYRSVYLKTDLSDQPRRRLLTSPHQFQSWTTSAALAMNVGRRNFMTLSGPRTPYLTVFSAATDDVDVVVSLRDAHRFIAALLRADQRRWHGVFNEPSMSRLYDNLRDAYDMLATVQWQDEIVVRSPVNRKLPAEVVSVTVPEYGV
jgi:hypothetical protein